MSELTTNDLFVGKCSVCEREVGDISATKFDGDYQHCKHPSCTKVVCGQCCEDNYCRSCDGKFCSDHLWRFDGMWICAACKRDMQRQDDEPEPECTCVRSGDFEDVRGCLAHDPDLREVRA